MYVYKNYVKRIKAKMFVLGYCSIEYKVCEDEANSFSISAGPVSMVDGGCMGDRIVIEGKFVTPLYY